MFYLPRNVSQFRYSPSFCCVLVRMLHVLPPPCGIDQLCMDIEGQPECSCLTNEQCEITGDTCDVTSNPPLCKCGNGTACSAGEECVGGVCYVSIPLTHFKLPLIFFHNCKYFVHYFDIF